MVKFANLYYQSVLSYGKSGPDTSEEGLVSSFFPRIAIAAGTGIMTTSLNSSNQRTAEYGENP